MPVPRSLLASCALLPWLALMPGAVVQADPVTPATLPPTQRPTQALRPGEPPAAKACAVDGVPLIGIVSAFGAEADLLLANLRGAQECWINGNRFVSGSLVGQPVVVVLTGVSVVNASMTTQVMLDHFPIERLLLSGIAGGIDPQGRVGDVVIPEQWALPLETWWGSGSQLPAPCGPAGDLSCLGLRLAGPAASPWAGFPVPAAAASDPNATATSTATATATAVAAAAATSTATATATATGGSLYMRENFVRRRGGTGQGEFRFSFPADAEMLALAATLNPPLERCGPRSPQQCVSQQPRLRVGGMGVTVPAFLANADYRNYLFATLQARVLDMESAAVAEVAYANGIPFLGLRSVSDLAGGGPNSDVGALFGSGLAESNAARVTLAWLAAWRAHALTPAAQSAFPQPPAGR